MGISLNLGLDIGYKQVRFSETLTEKKLEFVPSKRGGPVVFNLGLVLLLAKVNLILEKQSYKENGLVVRGTGRVKMILAQLTKVVAFHVGATIVQVGVPDLSSHIPKGEVCFIIFLVFNK